MKKRLSPQTDNNPYWGTPEFKELNDKWQKKLEKSGFEDIEQGYEPNRYLKRWDSTWFTNRRHGAQGTLEQMTYFQECTRFLNEYKFENALDKQIWACHSEGLTVAQTVTLLNYRKRLKKNKVTAGRVSKLVNKIKGDMFREFRYPDEQRN